MAAASQTGEPPPCPAAGKRRFLALLFPFLPANRLAIAGASPDAPFAFTEKQRGAVRLVALDPRAAALGLAPGLGLADARAQLPDLAVVDHDPAADLALLERIADMADRYTPIVAIDAPDALTLDISGAAHLFGGESALVADVEHRCARLGLHLRHALAGTPEAAQALARYQTAPAADEAGAIRRLPVAALGLEEETALALRRAGLKTIGDIAARPIAPIAARFGEEAAARIRRVLGLADSRLSPRRPPPALALARRFADPIARTEDVLATIEALAHEAADLLAARGAGGRRFAVRLFRADGETRDLAIETSLPLRDPAVLMRLMAERIDSLADPIDPGFGFDLIRMAVPTTDPMAPTQLDLDGDARSSAAGEDALVSLVDRLSTRLGRGRIRRLLPRDTHIPEQGVLALPAVESAARPGGLSWAAPDPGEPPTRPIHLLDPPQRVEVMAEVPDGPPHRFRWQRRLHDVTRFEGPERIAPLWWARTDEGLTRDYYRIEDRRGRRFWIFRHGLYGEERPDPHWYVHGIFV